MAGWQASDDGRLILKDTTVHDVATCLETDIAALLARHGHKPTEEQGPLRSSGDGSTIVANVDFGAAYRLLDLDRIDVDELATALADQTDYEHRWLIDPRTGEMVFWTSDTGIDGENPVDPDELDLS